MNYIDQIKADRRAATLERAAERAETGRDYRDEINALYTPETNTKMETLSATNRRLIKKEGDLGNFADRELNTITLRAMTARWTSDELKAKQRGQTSVMHKINTEIVAHLPLQTCWTHVHAEQDIQNADVRRRTGYLFANDEKIAAQATKMAQEIVSAM